MDNNVEQNIILYKSEDWTVKVDVILADETIWLPQKRMAELFNVTIPTINEHIWNIFKSWELNENSVIRNFLTTAWDGKKYNTKFYNLDCIIAVWYRVNSKQATHFRIWATNVLREYIIKWFALDDDRLKKWLDFWKNYFDELLERIRDIRSSERLFYQKITDIYAQCSIDYDPNDEMTKEFYATVQNKLHFAIHWHTASELIKERVDHNKPNMWLTSWKNWPEWTIRKSDVSIAKNYLNEDELKSLNRVVSMYLDYAENQAEKRITMSMADWVEKLNWFLQFNEYEILNDAWKVSSQVAKELAEKEYDEFKKLEDNKYISDFDKFINDVKNLESN